MSFRGQIPFENRGFHSLDAFVGSLAILAVVRVSHRRLRLRPLDLLLEWEWKRVWRVLCLIMTGLARGRWAIVENAAEFAVEPGTTVRITHGSRVVAEFLVEAVDGRPVGGPN